MSQAREYLGMVGVFSTYATGLSISVFPWADLRTPKGATKARIGFNHPGYLANCLWITEGSVRKANIGPPLNSSIASIVTMHRGYADCSALYILNRSGSFFLLWFVMDANHRVVKYQTENQYQGLTRDRVFRFGEVEQARDHPVTVWPMVYRVTAIDKHSAVQASQLKLSNTTITEWHFPDQPSGRCT